MYNQVITFRVNIWKFCFKDGYVTTARQGGSVVTDSVPPTINVSSVRGRKIVRALQNAETTEAEVPEVGFMPFMR